MSRLRTWQFWVLVALVVVGVTMLLWLVTFLTGHQVSGTITGGPG